MIKVLMSGPSKQYFAVPPQSIWTPLESSPVHPNYCVWKELGLYVLKRHCFVCVSRVRVRVRLGVCECLDYSTLFPLFPVESVH